MSTTHYDATLNDDAAHPHVVAAREAGRAWALREYEAVVGGPPYGDWYPTAIDARPLVEFGPTSDVEDQDERERELAEICNQEASDAWWTMTRELP